MVKVAFVYFDLDFLIIVSAAQQQEYLNCIENKHKPIMLGSQQSTYGIQSTAGAVPIRNEKGKWQECDKLKSYEAPRARRPNSRASRTKRFSNYHQ